MTKYIAILFLFTSCSTTMILQDGTTTTQRTILSRKITVTLNGSKSHAIGNKYLVATKWRPINGNATIKNPSSLVTNATMKGSCTFELWGQDNAGLTGRDTMNVIFQ